MCIFVLRSIHACVRLSPSPFRSIAREPRRQKPDFPTSPPGLADSSLAGCWPSLLTAMPHLGAEAKHHILLEYSPHDTTRSFAALAARHAVKGGERVVRRWHRRWDGSPASLQERPRSGRPRALSRAQVARHIATPIRHANRAHRAIHYTDLLPQVRAATGAEVSLRTVQHYGETELGAKKRRGIKRTAEESKRHITLGSAKGCAVQCCVLTCVCSGSCPV